VTFQKGRNFCKTNGGDLTSVHSKVENDYIWTKVCRNRECWIGFTDESSEGVFKWEDGSAITYTNWIVSGSRREPNNEQDREDHVIMQVQQNGGWNDIPSHILMFPACKKTRKTNPRTDNPTSSPSSKPTDIPTWSPTPQPTDIPTWSPTPQPTDIPTSPTPQPTNSPTRCTVLSGIKACNSSRQKRLEVSVANQMYEYCKCVYDYDNIDRAFIYRGRRKCYRYVRNAKGKCFKGKKYWKALKEILKRKLKKD